MADTFFSRHPAGTAPVAQLHELMKDFQCTKWFVNRKAIEIVDRALTASGGAGYLSANPLSGSTGMCGPARSCSCSRRMRRSSTSGKSHSGSIRTLPTEV